MRNGPHLRNLIDNAFDFLDTAVKQFKTEPKYSVIHFSSAVELILKTRLFYEHWSLIVSTKKNPSIEEFKKGNFKSLNFKDLIPRIEETLGEKIPEEAERCFNNLANHRNKMVHFFHEAMDDFNDEEYEKIALEQCIAIYHLSSLIEKWDMIFDDGAIAFKFDQIRSSMTAHREYVQTVFDKLKNNISKAKKDGVIFKECHRCQTEALEQYELNNIMFEYRCWVCKNQERDISLPCFSKDCDGSISFEEYEEYFICNKCDEDCGKEAITEYISKNAVKPSDWTMPSIPKNCASCHGMDTVVEYKNHFICLNCFFFTDQIEICGWCSEKQIGGGDLEFSGYSGCEFCDGQVGHMKDRD